MKRTIALIVLLGFVEVCFSQQFDSTAWEYSKSITAKELKEHLSVLASDSYEGRETGKKGQKMAMQYLIKRFKSYGIEDVQKKNYIQSYPLIEQEAKGVSLKLGENNYTLNKEFSISPSIIEKEKIEGKIVFVGYGIEEDKYNDYKGKNIEGKAVFIWNGLPEKQKLKEKWTSRKKIALARKKGAIAVFYYNDKLEQNLKNFEHYYNKSKITLKDNLKKETPVVYLTDAPTETILKKGKSSLKKVEKKGIKKVKEIDIDFSLNIDKPTKELTGENVLAFIPGTEKKEEVLVITAHYDHIGMEGDKVFNGADDDGTGTVSLLEIAQAFQLAVKQGIRPKRSILIMPVSGEEKGLLGSKYYTNHPVFPLENTVANLNIDMIGRYDKNHEKDSNYIYLIGSDKLSSDLHHVSEVVNEIYLNIKLDYTFNDENDPNRFYYRSDHYNFAKNNIPVIFYFSGVHEDYHKATDTVEKIDYKKTEKIARLVFLTAWHLVNQEKRIELD